MERTATSRIDSAPSATVDTRGEATTRLRGRALTLLRIGWGALFFWFVLLFILGIAPTYERALEASPAILDALSAAGLPPNFVAVSWLLLDIVTFSAFTACALFIVWRRSDDWMVMLTSLTLVGTANLYTGPSSEAIVPGVVIAFTFALIEILQVSFVYLFPNGRFVPRWLGWLIVPMFIWRPLVWAIVYIPNYLAMPRNAENYGTLRQDPIDTAVMILLFAIGIVSQVYRYRRVSTPTQRLQTKWLLYGVVCAILVAATYVIIVNALGLLDRTGLAALLVRIAGRTARQLALFMLPLTLTFSILRYRLWDIDIIIRRTLVYVPLTAILAGLFAATITLSQKLFVAVTGEQSVVATVLTTLVVVAAFTPVKDRLQAMVNRRFRDETEADRKIARFGERVRSRLSSVDAEQIIVRMTQEAVAVFGARGGAAYLEQGGDLILVQTIGEWKGQPELTVPLQKDGVRIGSIALGARQEDWAYTATDRAALTKVADIVATAIEQDRAGE